ncbi:NAD(P)H-binding protein [Streptomyces sp. NBC_01803]|uniref:NAD(P)H-binding protein n=1 Tax=Streptomyces sp. NBC_01803 TaxID=2975946 RepID=UPI002DD80B23|nr:NAD(P)H-binding protein [Streptomyces sp. NBC_01803]WSA47014.1 NAD(P)H-binding protein [Streptomyces sp. NBC_01803]
MSTRSSTADSSTAVPSTAVRTVLVTGATGTVGRALVASLLAAGASVRAVTRDPLTAGLPGRAQVVGGDPNAPETLAGALDGVSAVFVNPAAAGDLTGRLLGLARERGVGRAVLLSSAAVRDEAAQDADPLVFWHRLLEETVTASGLDWTVLRCSEFAANTLTGWGPGIRAAGVVREAHAMAASAPVHERDVADVAARVLLSGGHAGATLTVTGPESLTRRRMARIVAQAIGRPVRFERLPRERAVRHLMATRGLSEGIAESVVRLQEEAAGRPAFVTSEVERVTGRPALTFARWAAEHVADFARVPAPAPVPVAAPGSGSGSLSVSDRPAARSGR